MGFDVAQEDCLRLTLATMRRKRVFPLDNPQVISQCVDAYQQNPDDLIETDVDRSFHLVARATEALDYEFPFIADDAEAAQVLEDAKAMLTEACSLDPGNIDAERMITELTAPSTTDYLEYLNGRKPEVEARYRRLVDGVRDPYDEEFVHGFDKRQVLRWLDAIATRSLLAGRYRMALDAAKEALELEPTDPGNSHYTAELAMAKLECTAEELAAFRREHALAYAAEQLFARLASTSSREPRANAWSLLADIAVAYHGFAYPEVSRLLVLLLHSYPHAAEALTYQIEFPLGVFSRIEVEPGSEDELLLALNEASVLLQEGVGDDTDGSLSVWLAQHDVVQRALGNRSPEASRATRHGKKGL